MRVDRRDAINTAGESRTNIELLTFQIIVRLAASEQIQKGACTKILPQDTSTGFVTNHDNDACASTDHGETVATCFTSPIIYSGHQIATRTYFKQRPVRSSAGTPSAKTKPIKRHCSTSCLISTYKFHSQGPMYPDKHQQRPPIEYTRSGSISLSGSTCPSPSTLIEHHPRVGDSQSSGQDIHQSQERHQQKQLPTAPSHIIIKTGTPFEAFHQLQDLPLQAPPLQDQGPRILEVRPSHGPIRRVTDVVLRGLGFCDGMVPHFGSFPAQDIVVETVNLILCKAPECPLPCTVDITICDAIGARFAHLARFTYTDDSETELLILQLQLRMTYRTLELRHSQATGKRGSATDVVCEITGVSSSTSPHTTAGDYGQGEVASTSSRFGASTRLQTRTEVEESILKTLDKLPVEVDISMQIDRQGTLLHLSLLLGFARLARRLIVDGCDIEAMDAWAMTPLMYAVIRGNEAMVRELVLAGATTSGAKTAQEFFDYLPHSTPPTPAVVRYLSLSCRRFSNISRTLVSNASTGLLDVVEVELEQDEEDSGSDEETEELPKTEVIVSESKEVFQTAVLKAPPCPNAIAGDVAAMQENEGVYVSHKMSSLGQQDLPLMQRICSDGSNDINSKPLRGLDIAREFAHLAVKHGDVGAEDTPSSMSSQVPHGSGYQSGVFLEVQDDLQETKRPTVDAGTPINVFRTGDTFDVQVRLSMQADLSIATPLPREFLGLQSPYEMVKGVGGMTPLLMNEMTYVLKTSVELVHNNNITTIARITSTTTITNVPVVALQDEHHLPGDGICQVRARVNCSSLLHVAQREKFRWAGELSRQQLQQQQQQRQQVQQGDASEGSCKTLGLTSRDNDAFSEASLDLADLEDAGFIFYV
ncbi:SPT3 Dosage dependent suppressor of Ty-induced promoter mutations-like protein [Podila humilis]|nr:SPT3 Dosage dependent suppressor of Ty-induced promoter mutations-like protein [Podila humilis]